jgi:Predicted signal transduction protein with a C-terminal ATPase domain
MFGRSFDIFNTVTKRLVLTFTVIIIPICIIAYGIYNNGIAIIKKEILRSMQNRSEFMVNSMESDIIQVRSLINDFTLDQDIFNLAFRNATMNDYKKIETINKLQRSLTMIINSSDYFSKIGVCIPSIQRTVYTVGNIDVIDKKLLDDLTKPQMTSSAQFVNINGKVYIVSKYPYMPSKYKNDLMFLIFVEISNDKIKKYIRQSINNDKCLFTFGINSIGFSLTNEGERSILPAILDNLHIRVYENKAAGTTILDGRKFFYNVVSSKQNYFYFASIIPEEQVFGSLHTYIIWFWVFILIIVLVTVIYSFSTRYFIHNPVKKLVSAFSRIETGDTTVNVTHLPNDEFGYLYRQFNNMVSKLNELIETNYKQKILAKSAELQHLQAQINPHFLYNNFFLLNSMIQEKDYDNLKAFTLQLGNYFKYITRDFESKVPLLKEVNHARAYMNIQQMRYIQRIKVEFESLPEENENLLVPRLILQPVIENAFEHGLKNKARDGLVRVWFDKSIDRLDIIVEDNGEDLNETMLKDLNTRMQDTDSDCTGIINISRRLSLVFGGGSGIYFSRSSLGGLCVRIVIKA